MATNIRHKLSAVKAVVESAYVYNSAVWVDDGDVAEALTAIQKQSERDYPDVKAFTHETHDTGRVALKFK